MEKKLYDAIIRRNSEGEYYLQLETNYGFEKFDDCVRYAHQVLEILNGESEADDKFVMKIMTGIDDDSYIQIEYSGEDIGAI